MISVPLKFRGAAGASGVGGYYYPDVFENGDFSPRKLEVLRTALHEDQNFNAHALASAIASSWMPSSGPGTFTVYNPAPGPGVQIRQSHLDGGEIPCLYVVSTRENPLRLQYVHLNSKNERITVEIIFTR